MPEEVYGFTREDARMLKAMLANGGRNEPRRERNGDPWRFFGKIATAIAAGGTGTFEIWDMSAMSATGQTITGVKNPGAAAYPSDTSKIVGITRCGYSGQWVLDTEYCE